MDRDGNGSATGDSSEETVVSAPRFDGRAEERARPVVPLGDSEEEATRTRVASAGGRRPRMAGPKDFRRYALVALPLVALLTAVALAVQQRGQSGDAQTTPPMPETPAALAVPPEREEAADRDEGDRDNSRRAVRRGREGGGGDGGGDGRGRDGWRAEGRGEGGGEEGKGEREGRGRGRDKETEERIKKEREKYRERAKEAEKEFKRLKELFKDN